MQEKFSNLSEEDEGSELGEELRRRFFIRKLNLVPDEDRDGYDIYRFTRNKAFKTYYSEAKKLIQEALDEESKRF